jgi:hypothetical protein
LESQTVEHFRQVPSDCLKDWDNLGRVIFTHISPEDNTRQETAPTSMTLPSWVPDWNIYSTRDPDPLPALSDAEPERYWASGKNRPVNLTSTLEPDHSVLDVKGMFLDTIKTIALPWLIEVENLPISRIGVVVLEQWEQIALEEM